MSTSETLQTASTPEPIVSASALGRGLAALRMFVGIILFANGLAKVTGKTQYALGWYRGNLIGRDGARSILEFEVNKRGKT